ncbi:MAG TPA: hypothetical protein VFW34_06005 [Candidatus Rubrimentiphilum sp.]|nr:hypothetical protein [Candidatus Rubrimentiphilum sp.]
MLAVAEQEQQTLELPRRMAIRLALSQALQGDEPSSATFDPDDPATVKEYRLAFHDIHSEFDRLIRTAAALLAAKRRRGSAPR